MPNVFSSVKNRSPVKNDLDSSGNALSQLTFEMLGLEDENRTLRQILTSSSDPILITTKEAKIVYVNPAWEKLTGYSFDEVIGENPRILQSGKTPQRVYKKMWRTLIQCKTFTSDEVINRKKNGTEYQIRASIYPVIRNDEICYYVELQHDITETKRLDDLRKEFLSVSAHELKTPITVLKLLTQSHLNKAKKQGTDTIKAQELELIDRELDRLIRLINDMLDSSRFETGKQLMTFEETDLVDITKRTVEKFKIYARNHKITIHKLLPQALIIADPLRIEQVLLNLLSNAVKYSPDETTIVISMIKRASRYVVSVKDKGVGITKNRQNLIFDRYYQVKTKSKIGFGLGLYISKEIIKRHKGKIWVVSKKGKGSVFYFSLPSSNL